MSSKPLMMIRRSVNRTIFLILFNVYRIINFLIYNFKFILIVIMSSGTISWVKLQTRNISQNYVVLVFPLLLISKIPWSYLAIPMLSLYSDSGGDRIFLDFFGVIFFIILWFFKERYLFFF